VGHTLGLYHDGTTAGATYYTGHGNWAPIMGNPYYEPITQWSKGEYNLANNTEDDLQKMLNYGATYRVDDFGDGTNNATLISGDVINERGIIEKRTDLDIFTFQTTGGILTINADPNSHGPNLDIKLTILDSNGNPVGEDDPYYILPASLNISISAGTYYITIEGVGTGDPSTGYTDYASIGQYFITGNIPTNEDPPLAPTNMVATAAAYNQIDLVWTDNSNNENEFVIERSLDNINWATLVNTAANINFMSDTGLAPNTTYFYRVYAQNSFGVSGYSNITSDATPGQPPNAPSSLNATATTISDITLSWNDNSDNENGFVIERSLNNSTWIELVGLPEGTTSYDDTNLNDNTTYFYKIYAYNNNGDSNYSNTASDTTFSIPVDYIDQKVSGEVFMSGIVNGTFIDTFEDDAGIETITEKSSGGKPSRRHSLLEHKWMVSVQAGETVTLFINAWASNTATETFKFLYSIDDTEYIEMFNIVSTTDDGVYYTYELPSSFTGTVYIKLIDTVRTTGVSTSNSVYIDHIFIRTDGYIGEPIGMFVNDLTGTTSINKNKWDAHVTVNIKDVNNNPVHGVVVTGNWDNGITTTEITDSSGNCTFTKKRLRSNSTLFRVDNLDSSGYSYIVEDNIKSYLEVFRP
jgi:hypothetical protein